MVRLVRCELFDVAQVQEEEPNDGDEHTDNVSLASPLSSLAPHEVLGDDNLSELILFKLEPWHIIEHRVDEPTGADDPSGDSDCEPRPLVEQDVVGILDDESQASNDGHTYDILHQDLDECELELHVSSQVVVDEVNLLLGIENFSAAYEPLVCLFVHRWHIRRSFCILS